MQQWTHGLDAEAGRRPWLEENWGTTNHIQLLVFSSTVSGLCDGSEAQFKQRAQTGTLLLGELVVLVGKPSHLFCRWTSCSEHQSSSSTELNPDWERRSCLCTRLNTMHHREDSPWNTTDINLNTSQLGVYKDPSGTLSHGVDQRKHTPSFTVCSLLPAAMKGRRSRLLVSAHTKC